MKVTLESKLHAFPRPFFTDAELGALSDSTPDSRYSKVKRLLAKGKLLHIRRGLYCLASLMGHKAKPHPYELAQYIYGPSYISVESALSFHQLIPERVYTITSATSKKPKEFQTPLGMFSYLHLPVENLFIGVELVNENGHPFFLAKPWKAICDYVFCYKKNWKGLAPLIEDLRIDYHNLPLFNNEEMQLFADYYKSLRISRFLKGIQQDLYAMSKT